WFHECACGVSCLSVGHFVLDRINQFHVAERPRSLPDLARHTFVPFAADSRRPIHRGIRAHFSFPFRADLTQVISPNVSGSAAIRAMHHYDLLLGQFYPWVERGDFRVIPLLNVAEKSSCDGSWIEFHVRISRT